MAPHSTQGDLFGSAPPLPDGFAYRPEFVSAAEEAGLIARIAELPLAPAHYKGYEARRRILSYGSSYDFTANRLNEAPPVPEFLMPLRQRVAQWVGIAPDAFEHALLTEYEPGTPIGWHRDTPDFEVVVGVSFDGSCVMRFRRYPHVPHAREPTLQLVLEPRSAYLIRGEARWRWQHHIPPTTEHRYSITFRTLATRRQVSRGSDGAATI